MARSTYLLTFLAALAAASQAEALQLTNRDAEEHKIAMTEPAGAQDVLIKPSQVIDGLCKTGCTMKMADGEEYEFDGNEVVSIEEGLMFLDEPAEGSSAGTSGTDDAAAPDADKSATVPDPSGADNSDPEPGAADAASPDKQVR
jgi:hypothetical protein